jgi:peptidoglycan/LPS O-acetylase OafA/YrhL
LAKLGYRPELDGVRGVAIAGVLVFHVAPPLSGGSFGVQMFFVLSGFLITSILLGEWFEYAAISLAAFYRRRAFRLLPALVVALAAYLALSLLVAVARPGSVDLHERAVGAAEGAGYITNILEAWGHAPVAGLGHLWTLAAEEQFYIWWPVALIALLKLRPSLRVLRWSLAVSTLLLAAHAIWLTMSGAPELRVHLGPDTTPVPLLIGCFCATVAPGHARSRRLELVAVATVVVILIAGQWLSETFHEAELVIFAVSVGYLLVRMTAGPTLVTAALRYGPLVRLGRISYGVYLWHLIFIESTPWLAPIVGALLAIPVAELSYRYVELPFLRRKRRVQIDEISAQGEDFVLAQATT